MARMHHIGITVSDSESAARFYRELTDGEVTGPLVKSGPAVEQAVGHAGVEIHLTFVTPSSGGTVLELAEYRGADGTRLVPDTGSVGACHPAIAVDDIEASIARAAALGHPALSAPMTATAGPLEGYRYVYLLGPDEVRVELLEAPR